MAAAAASVHWDQLTDVERTCLGVSFARWHASAGGPNPCTWPDGTPWYSDPLGPHFVAGIPLQRQQEMEEVRLKADSWLRLFCAVRTAEIDHQIQTALQDSNIQQMVLLGAGMDTRAWRLKWPTGFSVFEVDSQQVLDFKHKMLRSGSNSSGDTSSKPEQQQQWQERDGLPPLSCARRVAVAADASKAEELWSRLTAAGFDAATPTVWVLEGFIGYLEREAGNGLLRLLATNSAPGSRIIMTAPPTPAEKERGHDAAIAEAAAAKAAADAAAAAKDAGAGGQASSSPATQTASATAAGTAGGGDAGRQSNNNSSSNSGTWHVAADGSRTYRPKLHHSTFEEPTETLARLVAAGWSECKLFTADDLGSKYGAGKAQPIMVGKGV